jgi:hypothetical protein
VNIDRGHAEHTIKALVATKRCFREAKETRTVQILSDGLDNLISSIAEKQNRPANCRSRALAPV